MSQKLAKSPTEISLTLPLSRGAPKYSEHTDHSSSLPCSKDSPAERDPQNTPKSFLKASLTDKGPTKKLANLLDINIEKALYQKTVPDTEKSPRESLQVKNKKVLVNNYTKKVPSGAQTETDLHRNKELAKMALSKMMVKDIAKKRTSFLNFLTSRTPKNPLHHLP